MRCECCGSEMQPELAGCQVCGCPNIIVIPEDDSSAEEINRKRADFVKEYKEKLLGGVGIYVIVHHYIVQNGRFTEDRTESVKLADALSLKSGEIKWLPREFEGIPSDRPFSLTIEIAGNSRSETKTLTIGTDGASVGHDRIGIAAEDGFNIRIVSGTQEDPVFSEPVSIIIQ